MFQYSKKKGVKKNMKVFSLSGVSSSSLSPSPFPLRCLRHACFSFLSSSSSCYDRNYFSSSSSSACTTYTPQVRKVNDSSLRTTSNNSRRDATAAAFRKCESTSYTLPRRLHAPGPQRKRLTIPPSTMSRTTVMEEKEEKPSTFDTRQFYPSAFSPSSSSFQKDGERKQSSWKEEPNLQRSSHGNQRGETKRRRKYFPPTTTITPSPSSSFTRRHSMMQEQGEKNVKPMDNGEEERTPPPRDGTLHARPSRSKRTPASSPHQKFRTSPYAPFAPYQETLSRPLHLRHSGKEENLAPNTTSTSTTASFDPALVVHVDSRTKQIFLHPIQKSLIWEARRKQYQACLEQLVRTLQSHLLPIEKCLLLMQLHETSVIPSRLRLRADTYDDLFHCFYATATLVRASASRARGSSNTTSTSVMRDRGGHRSYAVHQGATSIEEAEEWENVCHGEGGDHSGKSGGGGSSPSSTAFALGVPVELSTRSAAVLTMTSEETMQEWWKMYRYMVDSGTNPTPRILQHVMGLLEQRARWRLAHGKVRERTLQYASSSSSPAPGMAILEAKAHSLMMDADRFHFCPTTFTVNSYIYLCQVCGCMHLALGRVTDVWKRWQQQPTGATYALLLHGFLHQPTRRMASDTSTPNKTFPAAATALSVLTTMQSTPISLPLLHEILQVMRYSQDPLSAFTVYKSVMSRRTREGRERPSPVAGLIVPTLHTFSILVEALLRTSETKLLPVGKEREEEAREKEKEEKNSSSRSTELVCSSNSSSSSSSFPTHLLKFLLHEMKRYGVRGNQLVLNKILECFRRSGQRKQFCSLRQTMRKRGILVFDEYRKL